MSDMSAKAGLASISETVETVETVERTRPVEASIRLLDQEGLRVDKSIAELDAVIERLTSRLTPVLGPELPSAVSPPSEADQSDVAECALAMQIKYFANAEERRGHEIRTLSKRLTMLIDRIEL